jgi:hypothetical protein
LGRVDILFSRSGNNAKGDLYCLRARDRVASAARRSSDVLPYLGPEIIAVMQAVSSSSPNRFAKRPPPSVPWQKPGQNRPVAGLVVQSELLQFKDCECPQLLGPLAPLTQPCLDAAADLGWIENLLAFIGVRTFRQGWNRVGRLKRR